MNASLACPLSKIQQGCCVRICGFHGSKRAGRLLANLWILPDTVLNVISPRTFGALVVARGGCRMAIGYDVAKDISVNSVLPAKGISK